MCWLVFFAYFSVLLSLAPEHILTFDSYYYWEWSRHLDLSYYDGPPMIAYLIKLTTLLFGNTLLALNVVSIVCVIFTACIIYKTARLFLPEEASCVAMMLWLFAPLNTLDLLKQTTYDAPYILFWALSVYCIAHFIQATQNAKQGTVWLYLSGVSIGCMMLSKYSGIILGLGLLVFILATHYHYLFKNIHFYLALLVSFLVFTPVIIWNLDHNWLSFLYQMSTHVRADDTHPLVAMVLAFLGVILPSLNGMLLPLIIGFRSIMKNKIEPIPYLCMIISFAVIVFYLLYALKNKMVGNWLSPYMITAALLGGYCFQRRPQYRKSTVLFIIFSGLISFIIAINNVPRISFSIAKGYIYHQLIQGFNTYYPSLPKFIFTTTWSDARMLFFLKDKPEIYTLDHCGTSQNEYAFWSQDFVKNVANKSIKEALYMDRVNNIDCVKKYFDQCVPLSPPIYHFKDQNYAIYAYKCTNT